MIKTRMIVFDMAGTTIDENNLVYHTLHQTILQNGFNCTIDDVLLHGAGKEKRNAIIDVLSASQELIISNETIEYIFQTFLKNLENAYLTANISPQPFVLDVFEQLKRKNIYVVLNTGYDRKTASGLLEKLNWDKGVHYDLLVTASDVKHSRPFPDMIQYAMHLLKIEDSSTVVKIGDSAIDILEGKNANCGLCVGITTGAQSEEQMLAAKPDFIINNLLELIPLLN